MKLKAGLLAAVLLLAFASPALAAAGCPRASLGDIEDEVMCPRCGTPLNVVDSEPLAQRERAFIQRLIDQCETKDQIKSAMVAQFGPEVLALPQDKGFDRAAYIVPIALGLLAATGIALTALRWRGKRGRGARRAAAATPIAAGPALDQRDADRLKADLDSYEL
ncbi:MAG: cytochrome c-type biosis protein CcmH [Thermoleophilaceae bacterium]|nr:cytochrome c-type biosis protein CcmH [Thermoleophilaceae bacterium]